MFSFDNCVSECQHGRKRVEQSRQFLREWLQHSKVHRQLEDLYPGPEPEGQILKFVFLFGSQATGKSEELNLMNKNSMIQEFVNDL